MSGNFNSALKTILDTLDDITVNEMIAKINQKAKSIYEQQRRDTTSQAYHAQRSDLRQHAQMVSAAIRNDALTTWSQLDNPAVADRSIAMITKYLFADALAEKGSMAVLALYSYSINALACRLISEFNELSEPEKPIADAADLRARAAELQLQHSQWNVTTTDISTTLAINPQATAMLPKWQSRQEVKSEVLDAMIEFIKKLPTHKKWQNVNIMLTKFYFQGEPSIQIESFIARLLFYISGLRALENPNAKFEQYVVSNPETAAELALVVAITYLYKLQRIKGSVIDQTNIYKLLLAALNLGENFTRDNPQDLNFFAGLGGISLTEMNQIQVELLKLFNFNVHLTPEEIRYTATRVLHLRSEKIDELFETNTRTRSDMVDKTTSNNNLIKRLT